MTDLLIELGCEELPAGSVVPMAEHLGKALSEQLHSAGLCSSSAQIFATPRRIAARLTDVVARQADATVERRGPAVKGRMDCGQSGSAWQVTNRGAG